MDLLPTGNPSRFIGSDRRDYQCDTCYVRGLYCEPSGGGKKCAFCRARAMPCSGTPTRPYTGPPKFSPVNFFPALMRHEFPFHYLSHGLGPLDSRSVILRPLPLSVRRSSTFSLPPPLLRPPRTLRMLLVLLVRLWPSLPVIRTLPILWLHIGLLLFLYPLILTAISRLPSYSSYCASLPCITSAVVPFFVTSVSL